MLLTGEPLTALSPDIMQFAQIGDRWSVSGAQFSGQQTLIPLELCWNMILSPGQAVSIEVEGVSLPATFDAEQSAFILNDVDPSRPLFENIRSLELMSAEPLQFRIITEEFITSLNEIHKAIEV